MVVVYIASAYTNGNQAENVRAQIEVYLELINLGYCPIAPLLSHYVEIYKPIDYEKWLQIDFELIKRSDVIFRIPDKKGVYSEGATKESVFAIHNKIPVVNNMYDLSEVRKQINKKGNL